LSKPTAAPTRPPSTPATPPKGKGFTVAGHHVSYDAVMLVGAALFGLFLWSRRGQPASAAAAGNSVIAGDGVNYAGAGATTDPLLTMPPPPAQGSGDAPPTGSNPAPAPTSAPSLAAPLPQLNASLFPRFAPSGTAMALLGTISGPGGQFTGVNVQEGAPVWAYQHGRWEQGFNARQLAPGTPLATLANLAQYESTNVVTEQLGH
jgi:hypothetical protein